MASDFDLDRYLNRIGYTGDRTVSLETLRAIHQRHVQTFPFENINPLMRWPVLLDIASLQAKLVDGGRGGYCYEQNLLMKAALEALGFSVTGLAARVLSSGPADRMPARTHMLLRIDLDGNAYIVDVGFGRFTLSEPIAFKPDVIQSTSHERRRLVPVDGEYLMEAEAGGEWRSVYQFALAPHYESDYAIVSWYLCHHPDSHFTKRLIAARPTPDGRYTLRNNELTFHKLDGSSETTRLTTAAALRDALTDKFLLTLPDDADLERVLAETAATPAETP